MEFNEYQKAANKTLHGNEQVLTNCALGLASETGQVVDLVKKYTFHGDSLDREKLVKEMGDVLGTYLKLQNGTILILKKLLNSILTA